MKVYFNTDLDNLIGNTKKHTNTVEISSFLNSATQILREINFGYFQAPKTAILTN